MIGLTSFSLGEQAEIVFTLIGEPPFTFTYQRAELAQYARGRKPKVLETHTVAGVTGSEYSIFSSAEGLSRIVKPYMHCSNYDL